MSDETPTPESGNETRGYHLADIVRGVYGEPSKIFEETDEFADAIAQKVALMGLVELSDLVGAIMGFLEKYHPSLTIDDLIDMALVSKRVFENGHRESKA